MGRRPGQGVSWMGVPPPQVSQNAGFVKQPGLPPATPDTAGFPSPAVLVVPESQGDEFVERPRAPGWDLPD